MNIVKSTTQDTGKSVYLSKRMCQTENEYLSSTDTLSLLLTYLNLRVEELNCLGLCLS